MKYLIILLMIGILQANEYSEPANTYINYGYKIGLVSESNSEHIDSYLSIAHRLPDSALFIIGRYGWAHKTQDTYNQQCTEPYEFTNVCPPDHVVDNSLDINYIEYGASFHMIENRNGFLELEIVNRSTLGNSTYFNGLTTTLGIGFYMTQSYGFTLRSGISLATGWNAAGEFFIKF